MLTSLKYIFTLKGILLFLFLAHMLLPIVGFFTPGVVYMANTVLLYVMYFMLNGRELKNVFKFAAPFLLLTIVRLYNSLSSPSVFGLQFYGEMQILFWPIWCYYIFKHGLLKEGKYIVILTFIFCIITMITTIIGVTKFPGASRILATDISRSDPQYVIFMLNNIAGFSFTYIVASIFPMLICSWKVKRINNILFAVLAILTISFTYETEYTTAVIMVLLSMGLIFVKHDITKKQALILIGIVATVAFSAQYIFADLFSFLGDSTKSTSIQDRMYELSSSMNGVETHGDFADRKDLFSSSFTGFLRNPITGGGGAGGHSYILDILANYGLIGGIPLFWIYTRIYKYLYKPFESEPYFVFMLFSFFTCIFLAIVNTNPLWFTISCIVPMCGYMLSRYAKE